MKGQEMFALAATIYVAPHVGKLVGCVIAFVLFVLAIICDT